MLKGFKNKRYWMLLPPFLITGIVLAIYLPHNLKPLAILTALAFWIVFYAWNYLSENKSNEVHK
jgi:hypothetical protein